MFARNTDPANDNRAFTFGENRRASISDNNNVTLPLIDVRTRVAQHETQNTTARYKVADLKFEDGSLKTPEGNYPLSQTSLISVSSQLGVPVFYVPKLEEPLRSQVLDYHRQRGALKATEIGIASREGEFLGFQRVDLVHLPGTTVLDAIARGVGSEQLEACKLVITPEYMQVDLLACSIREAVQVGDVWRSGLTSTHYFTGRHATIIRGFQLRLVCLNGMSVRKCIGGGEAALDRTRRLPAGREDALQLHSTQIERLAAEAWAEIPKRVEALRSLRSETVDVPQLLTRWLERARISTRRAQSSSRTQRVNIMDALLQAWATEGSESTTYGALNAMTRVATHTPRLSPRLRTVISGLAGVLAFSHRHFCPRCLSMLTGASEISHDAEVTT